MKNADFIALCKNGTLPTLSEGNKKLIPTATTKFLIWNIPAVSTCPYKTAMCECECYAKIAEMIYPNVRVSRERNYKISLANDFTYKMLIVINHYMSKEKYKNANAVYFRIHESGDFYSREYLNKWLEIISACKDLYKNLYFNVYTKSTPFLTHTAAYYKAMYPNLIINISIWADSPTELVNKAHAEKWNIYTAVPKNEIDTAVKMPGCVKCRCADCGTCTLCLTHKSNPLVKICEIH